MSETSHHSRSSSEKHNSMAMIASTSPQSQTQTPTIEKLAWDVTDRYFTENPAFLVAHHLDSYNDFINRGIFNVFKENGTIKYVSIVKVDGVPANQLTLYLGGRDGTRVYFGKPIIADQSHTHLMYPNDARLRNMTYAATIHFDVDVDFEFTPLGTTEVQKQTITLDKIYLGRFPIMLQSCLCILQGMERQTRYQMGECLNDYGGYFIIDGNEKVVISQETFADNMIYIRTNKADDEYTHSAEIRSKSEDTSKPIRTTAVKIVAPSATWTNGQIVVMVPNVRKPVPLFILMRALGVISDEDIIRTCLLDLDKNATMIDAFIPSIHDAATIYTQDLAIKYIASFTKRGTISGAMAILSDYFLPHVGELNFAAKAYFIGLMTYRVLKVRAGEDAPTDRDHYQYKRVELTGDLLYALFREYFLLYRKAIYQEISLKEYYHRGQYQDNFISIIEANVDEIFTSKSRDKKQTVRIIEDGFRRAFKGNWGSQENTKREGVVQELNRLSWNTFISHLRKLNLPMDSSAKVVAPRLLNASQWGVIDPIDTPDGANIGLHKHLALGARITSGFSAKPLIIWLRAHIGLKWLSECTPEYIVKLTKVFVNGNWVGVIDDAIETEWMLKLYRRNGVLPPYMSIAYSFVRNELTFFTDSGRLIRPIFYILRSNMALRSGGAPAKDPVRMVSYKRQAVIAGLRERTLKWADIVAGLGEKSADAGFSLANNRIYEVAELYPALDDDNRKIYDAFVKNASVIDYIDSAEEETALIALMGQDGEIEQPSSHHTHIEMTPSLGLGVMGNQIIFPENNPLTRNSFSCGQSKQAVSLYHTNYAVRMDKMSVVLNYGQTPLIKSRMLQYMNHEEQPYGINCIVAIMCYTGYNVEDAVLINKSALDRGLFRTTYYTTYETHEESAAVTGGAYSKFANIEKNNVIGIKPGYDYSQLDDNGMIREGTPVTDRTVLIGKLMSNLENKELWIDSSETPKKGQLGFVDKSFITEGEEGFNIAKVRIFEQRTPAPGDKFASRSGQKGTIGIIVPDADMPYTANGLKPHIIINPHAIPSRMTVGQVIESILGKLCAHNGAFGDCTAFQSRGINYYNYAPHLLQAGYSFTGCEIMYNGMTGEQIGADVYMGPTYYMRLKHMVKDKINYRALGPRSQLTRQTVGGRANDGGLRIGEMERDGVLAHGMTAFLNDSFLNRGDDYYLAICNKTGMIAVYNEPQRLFLSPMADGPLQFVTANSAAGDSTLSVKNISRFGRSFSIVRIPYAFKLLMQELQAMNVNMRIITEDNIGQLMNMSYSFNLDRLLGRPDPVTPAFLNADYDGVELKAHLDETLKELHNRITGALGESKQGDNVTADLRGPQTYLRAVEAAKNDADAGDIPSENKKPLFVEQIEPKLEVTEEEEIMTPKEKKRVIISESTDVEDSSPPPPPTVSAETLAAEDADAAAKALDEGIALDDYKIVKEETIRTPKPAIPAIFAPPAEPATDKNIKSIDVDMTPEINKDVKELTISGE